MKQFPKDVVATFSIVGFDPVANELGIAVQSKFLGVGSVVPWAKAGVGAVATQSYANTSYGPEGLRLMEKGKSATQVIKLLTDQDDQKALRQVGIVDGKGNAATFTGEKCYHWAGGKTGKYYAAQGNILVGPATVDAMGKTFENSEGTLAKRLLSALDAGQMAGGDKRGRQSAALLVVKEKGGYGGFNDRYVDLRVDDHPQPIKELIRIYQLQRLYFSKPNEGNIIDISGEVKVELIHHLVRLKYLKENEIGEAAIKQALTTFIHSENFEERACPDGKLDKEVLNFMRHKR